MSATTLAYQGMALVDASDFAAAIPKLTAALSSSRSPTWLLARSKAYVGTKEYPLALADANEGWHAALSRSNRQQMADAQYRRAVAYFRLGRFADADRACVWAMRLYEGKPAKEPRDVTLDSVDGSGRYVVDPEEVSKLAMDDPTTHEQRNMKKAMQAYSPVKRAWGTASSFRQNALRRLRDLPEDDPGHKPLASMVPDLSELSEGKNITTATKITKITKIAQRTKTTTEGTAETAKTEPNKTEVAKGAVAKGAVADPAAPMKIRTQDFQTNTHFSLSVFTKGVDKNIFRVSFEGRRVYLDPINYPDGSARSFELIPWGEVDTTGSTCLVTPNKVELSLKKATAGKWPQLEGDGTAAGYSPGSEPPKAQTVAVENTAAAPTPAEKQVEPESDKPTQPAAPSYPTSSKSGPKNWDKVGVEEDEEDKDRDVNHFFKQLYSGATPDQQRAMMKSFVESNGTTLSTDWDDVKGRTVETKPPEGVEAKKWAA